ncbi:SHOCT domain-containing protein [Cellulomonas sp. PhB143]|uniref:SHOCT domain-containing protein n=1 Tax=Cellulomonas sp. PhB143 TaxID=2485186 RepID=UPI000FA918E9|nr:SHOCT domain-containing protein [Cellulomonas sp. PhB143]ROS75615.1 putative oligomerization/nucleic acid binding protein [Cellulomonas sp. PhB143]
MIRRVGRVGRPGLIGTAARTAVIAGTANAVTGAQNRRRSGREQEAYEQQQYQAQQQQAAMQAAAQQAAYEQMQAQQAAAQQAPAQVAATPAGGGDDLMAQLEKLAGLKQAGVLSDAEFSAAKAKLLG